VAAFGALEPRQVAGDKSLMIKSIQMPPNLPLGVIGGMKPSVLATAAFLLSPEGVEGLDGHGECASNRPGVDLGWLPAFPKLEKLQQQLLG